MTQQERIWWEIKACSLPIGVGELSDRLGLDRRIVRKSLWHVRKCCVFTITGKGTATRYLVPEGETYKCPGKGKHENSRRQLRPWHWEKGLAAMQAKRVAGHSGTKSIPNPKPKIALEQYWPSMITGR